MLNNMKSVTPGSIAYAALMVRSSFDWEQSLIHVSISSATVSTPLTTGAQKMTSLSARNFLTTWDAPDDYWVQDTLSWWNV